MSPTFFPATLPLRLVAIAELGNMVAVADVNLRAGRFFAVKLGRPLQWDPKKEEFLSDEVANAIRTRVQREEFKIDV